MTNRVRGLVLAASLALASSLPTHAQTAATSQTPQAAKTPAKPASLVGLTQARVKAQFGAPATTAPNVWTYNRPTGALKVYFKNGVVSETRSATSPPSRSYTNVDGNRIQSPTKADAPPPGATAQCRDGSYSFSAHRQGTCSHHGGVAHWL
jgi:uncharacterized protein DUF3761